jgi:hypothetical protein
MSASTDFDADSFGADPLAKPQVFRRRNTVIFASVFAVLAITVAVLIGIREIHDGLVAALPVVVLALVMGVFPRVTLERDRLAVHNSIFWFDVPYSSVSELKRTRLGVVIRTYAGKLVPVAAYASGSGKRLLGHADAADELIRAVQERTAYIDDSAWRAAPPPKRRVETRNLIALVASLAITVVMIVLATNS